MADRLLNWVDAMNGIPDNQSNLITPTDTRELWLSTVADRGGAYLSIPGPLTVPIVTQNVWVDIPNALGGAPNMSDVEAPLFWRMNANGANAYDYAADWPTVDVQAGISRYVRVDAVVVVDLVAANDIYEFAVTVDGVPLQPIGAVEESTSQEVVTVAIQSADNLEVITAPLVSVAVRNTETDTDLDILEFGYAIIGGPHA